MEGTLERNTERVAQRVGELRAQLNGRALLPHEDGFAEAKQSWNLTLDHSPSVVIVAADESDVAAAVRFAAEEGLKVCVQATGHGQPRLCDGGLLLVVRDLNQVTIDPVGKTATVGGGTLWEELTPQAVANGLVAVSGSSPNVGVVGYTLGGGYGLLSRKFGLATDSVTAFRIVLPNGEIKAVSATVEPDLYWSVLGGGGAYGVITEITMRLHDHGPLFGGSVMFDASLASTVYPAYVAWTKTLPDEVSSAIIMMTFPPVPFIPEFLHGRSMLTVCATVLDAAEVAGQWLAPIRNLSGAEFDSFHPMRYADSAEVFRDPVDPIPANGRGVLLTALDQEAIDSFLKAFGTPNQSPNLMVQIRHLGGAMSRQGDVPNATCDRRRANYLMYLLGVPMGPVTPDMMAAHAEAVFQALDPYVLSRGPLNWLGEGNVTREEVQGVFSEDEHRRLTSVKQAVDPRNLFPYAGVGIED